MPSAKVAAADCIIAVGVKLRTHRTVINHQLGVGCIIEVILRILGFDYILFGISFVAAYPRIVIKADRSLPWLFHIVIAEAFHLGCN